MNCTQQSRAWSSVEEKVDIKDGVPISSCVNCMKHEQCLMMDRTSPLPHVVQKPLDPETYSFVLLTSFTLGRRVLASNSIQMMLHLDSFHRLIRGYHKIKGISTSSDVYHFIRRQIWIF